MTNEKAKNPATAHVAHAREAGAVAGEVAGAVLGSAAGPVGAIVGMVVGGLAGTLAGDALGRDAERADAHDAELDEDIGVASGDLGRPSVPPRAPAEKAKKEGWPELADLDEPKPDKG